MCDFHHKHPKQKYALTKHVQNAKHMKQTEKGLYPY